jgi:hypothetical protein
MWSPKRRLSGGGGRWELSLPGRLPSDRMARAILSQLTTRGLLTGDTPKGAVRIGLPTDDVDRLFPKLFYEI